MPVKLEELRDALLPGLQELAYDRSQKRWEDLFAPSAGVINFNNGTVTITRHQMLIIDDPWYQPPLPVPPLPVAIAMGAAAVIMKNPVVSRRFWANASNNQP